MAPEKSTWDHAADKDLLLTMIDKCKTNLDWVVVAEAMTAKQYTFTKEACRQHFQKIRRESRQGVTTNGSGTANTNNANGEGAAATPNKRKSNGTAKNSTQAKGKGHSTNVSFSTNGHAEDDDEETMSPTKRKKTVKDEENGVQQTAPIFKTEAQSSNGVVDLENEDMYDY